MINITEAIVFAIALSVFSLLIFNNIRLMIDKRKLVNEIIQYVIDRNVMLEEIDSLTQANDLLMMQESDGFVKFLSESRDWAFSYIEQVQKDIKSLSQAMGSAEESAITIAYANILKHLPKEENND
jgi:hypothetical protein